MVKVSAVVLLLPAELLTFCFAPIEDLPGATHLSLFAGTGRVVGIPMTPTAGRGCANGHVVARFKQEEPKRQTGVGG